MFSRSSDQLWGRRRPDDAGRRMPQEREPSTLGEAIGTQEFQVGVFLSAIGERGAVEEAFFSGAVRRVGAERESTGEKGGQHVLSPH